YRPAVRSGSASTTWNGTVGNGRPLPLSTPAPDIRNIHTWCSTAAAAPTPPGICAQRRSAKSHRTRGGTRAGGWQRQRVRRWRGPGRRQTSLRIVLVRRVPVRPRAVDDARLLAAVAGQDAAGVDLARRLHPELTAHIFERQRQQPFVLGRGQQRGGAA